MISPEEYTERVNQAEALEDVMDLVPAIPSSYCEFEGDDCHKAGTEHVKWVLGWLWLCPQHAWIVKDIEGEWNCAEADYYGQP